YCIRHREIDARLTAKVRVTNSRFPVSAQSCSARRRSRASTDNCQGGYFARGWNCQVSPKTLIARGASLGEAPLASSAIPSHMYLNEFSIARLDALATRCLTAADSAGGSEHSAGGSEYWGWGLGGAGPPVVLLHGGSGSWTHWARNIMPLARHFTVWVPDLPGFGDSGLPPGVETAEALADIV